MLLQRKRDVKRREIKRRRVSAQFAGWGKHLVRRNHDMGTYGAFWKQIRGLSAHIAFRYFASSKQLFRRKTFALKRTHCWPNKLCAEGIRVWRLYLCKRTCLWRQVRKYYCSLY